VEAHRRRLAQSFWPVVAESALLLPGAAWPMEVNNESVLLSTDRRRPVRLSRRSITQRETDTGLCPSEVFAFGHALAGVAWGLDDPNLVGSPTLRRLR
jgi:hypothetical protein